MRVVAFSHLFKAILSHISKMSASSGKCDRTETFFPTLQHPATCASRSARKVLPTDPSRRCPGEYNDKPATWLKYEDVELEQGKWTNKMTEHHGTRAELIGEIMNKYQDWSFHRYVWLVHAVGALLAPH